MDCKLVIFLQGAVQKSKIIYNRSLENAQFQESSLVEFVLEEEVT